MTKSRKLVAALSLALAALTSGVGIAAAQVKGGEKECDVTEITNTYYIFEGNTVTIIQHTWTEETCVEILDS